MALRNCMTTCKCVCVCVLPDQGTVLRCCFMDNDVSEQLLGVGIEHLARNWQILKSYRQAHRDA